MGGLSNCCCGNCEACCIARLEIDFAVPQAGQPGATIGSLAWDVTEDPTLFTYNDPDDGQPICEWRYYAPSSLICSSPGTFTANALWLQITRVLAASYRKALSTVIPFDTEEFIGNEVWKTNEIPIGFYVEVAKKGSQIRSRVYGTMRSEFLRYPEPGSVLNRYSGGGCSLYFTNTYSTTRTTMMCLDRSGAFNPLNSACRLGDYSNTSFILLGGVYDTILEWSSGWVTTTCASPPTNVVLSSKWREFNADPSPPGSNNTLCRLPTGTPTNPPTSTLHPCDPFSSFSYSFSTPLEWLCDHKLRVIPCE